MGGRVQGGEGGVSNRVWVFSYSAKTRTRFLLDLKFLYFKPAVHW